MAVALRGSPVIPTGGSGNPTTGYSITIPSQTTAGDLLFLTLTSRDSTGLGSIAVTDNDSGGNTWTNFGHSSTDYKLTLWWKRATSGTASKTLTVAGCVGSCSGVLKVFSGADDGATPYADVAFETNASGDETHAGFTPTVGASMICCAICNYNNDNSVSTLSFATAGATTMTEHTSTGGSDCGNAFGHVLQGARAATGNLTWAQTDGTTYSAVWTIKPLAHTSTGVINAPNVTPVAGTAAHKANHPTSGALTGAGKVIVGAAAHNHRASGALTGPGSAVAGVAAHHHKASGAITGSAGAVAGSAVRETAPTVALNTADAHDFGSDTTPTLEFTGSDDGLSHDLTYEVQIATDGAFSGPGTHDDDAYSESNADTAQSIYLGSLKRVGQSFTSQGGVLDSGKVLLEQSAGGASGNAYVKVYDHSGTWGSTGKPNAAAIATSDAIDVTALNTYPGFGVPSSLVTVAFSGAERITLGNGTRYIVTVEYEDASSDASHCVVTGIDASTPSHGGNLCYYSGSSWTASAAFDMPFHVVTETAGSIVLDELSAGGTGWANTVDGGDSDPFTSGQKVSFTVQAGDALANGTYYWRARAKDPSGTNKWGAWPSARTFSVNSVVDHACSGALTGPGSAVAGTAAHVAIHATSGAIAGPGTTVVGSAARFRAFATSGTVTGPGASVVGVAVYNAKHETSGVLAGSSAAIAGSAARLRQFATSGVLTAAGAEVVATAARMRAHPTTGELVAAGTAVEGTADRTTPGAEHDTSGVLVGQTALAGTAHHTAIHDTSGAIAGAGANVAGVAAHHHTAAGVITGAGAAVAGSAARMRAHATQAVLAAGGSTVVGAAARLRAHTASGALPGKTAAVVGIALHNRLHATAGALAGTGASVVGVAHRTLEHATVADLIAQGSIIVGQAQAGKVTHDMAGVLAAGSATLAGAAARSRVYASIPAPGSERVLAESGERTPALSQRQRTNEQGRRRISPAQRPRSNLQERRR